jgi:hypothetical protein
MLTPSTAWTPPKETLMPRMSTSGGRGESGMALEAPVAIINVSK